MTALDRVVHCARNNTFTCGPTWIICVFVLVALHEHGGQEGAERVVSGLIGGIIGWIGALWAMCFLLKFGGEA